MPFNENIRLDPAQVEDVRGRGLAGGMALRGGLGLVAVVVAVLLGINPADLGVLIQTPAAQPRQTSYQTTGGAIDDCKTGADANRRTDCRVVGYVNSIQAYWNEEFRRRGAQYRPARTQLFSGATQAACGYATAAMGPFYCPSDGKVYLDLTFFDDLRNKYGARGGPFAEAYVLAHEYGHHVQNLAGVLDQRGGGATGPNSVAVAIELQADCLAGVWAHNAAATGFIKAPTKQEIGQALDAAAAVGDDRIQRQTQGRVTPESWTHGSSQQRQQWFTTGLQTGNLDACAPGSR